MDILANRVVFWQCLAYPKRMQKRKRNSDREKKQILDSTSRIAIHGDRNG